MQLVGDRFGLWIHDDFHVARAQPPPMSEKPERKTRREFEPIYQHLSTLRKLLLDALLGGGPVRNVNEIRQRSLFETRPALSSSPPASTSCWPARLNQHFKRREQ